MAAPHSPPLDPGLPRDKPGLRAAMIARRAAARPSLGVHLAAAVLAQAPPPPGAAVAGFWPMGVEIDVRPLLLALLGRGHAVLLPETPPRGNPLRFRRWRPGTPMLPERFGTSRPDGPLAVPDLLLVPLLAFDRAGRRLGYGGGYYDRTIAGLPGVRTIGCAYALQEVDEVPAMAHDARLHAVATERGVIKVAEVP
jgi:5-formyltetrahydrofolate cyclo-ligase